MKKYLLQLSMFVFAFSGLIGTLFFHDTFLGSIERAICVTLIYLGFMFAFYWWMRPFEIEKKI